MGAMGALAVSSGERRHVEGTSTLYLAGVLSSAAALLTAIGLVIVAASMYPVRLVELDVADRWHLALNVACAWLVGAISWRSRGQLEQKLSQALTSTVVVYGIFCLCILGGRLFFSRPITFASASAALTLGFLVILIKHSLNRPRVGLIDPTGSATHASRTAGEDINDPDTDLRQYDILLVNFTDTVDASWARAISRAMLSGTTIRHVDEYIEDRRGVVALDHFDVEQVPDFNLTSYRHLKRTADVLAVIVLIPFVLPLIGIASVLIVLTTGTSPFFLQKRVGLGGVIFRIWKLRTMRDVVSSEVEVRAAVPGDARITAIGRILRNSHIDELPQLWNVFKGDMTLIGPRPEAVGLHESYLSKTPAWAYRTLVRPGITGWAQVCVGPSSNMDEARQKLAYDLHYVKRMSFLFDMKIIARTIWVVLKRTGGY